MMLKQGAIVFLSFMAVSLLSGCGANGDPMRPVASVNGVIFNADPNVDGVMG